MSKGKFESVNEAIQAVKAKVDDVDSVIVFLNGSLASQGDEDLSEVGMLLNYCSGQHGFVSKSLAVHLLNDGIFTRLKIPIQYI